MKFGKGSLAMGMGLALIGALAMAPRAEAARVIVTPGFGFYYGPTWYYSPWAPGYAYTAPAKGDVKIESSIKGESIFVDGGYAGLTGQLKKFSLQPGNHQIEVRDAAGRMIFANTVHVIAGQTVDIHC